MNDDYFTWNQCFYWSCEQWTCNCNPMNPISDNIKLHNIPHSPLLIILHCRVVNLQSMADVFLIATHTLICWVLTYSVLEYIWVSPYAISNWILNFIFLSFRFKLSKRIEIYTQSIFFYLIYVQWHHLISSFLW